MKKHHTSAPPRPCCAPNIVMAGDFTVKAGWTLGPRRLNDYELVYFPVGSRTEYRLADQTYFLDEPCFVLTRPVQEHTYIFDPSQPTRHLFIHFMFDPLNASYQLSSIASSEGLSFLPSGQASLVPSLMKHILHLTAAKPVNWEERCNLLLYAILAEIDGPDRSGDMQSSNPNMPGQIMKALHYVEKNLHLPLSIANVAKNVGWTHEHFTRMFVQHMGISPQKAIIHRRIERACQLLIQTESTIKQIAYAIGFQDEHYFSRCFTRVKGITASVYREQFSDPRVQHLAPTEQYQVPYPLNRFLVAEKENHIK